MGKRNYGIDCIKCLMTMLIMLYHYTYRYFEMFDQYPGIYQSSLKYGGTIGVAVFFIISSYYSMDTDYKSFKGSLLSKFLRLYPAYLMAIIIEFVIIWITHIQTLQVTGLDFLLNIIFIARYIGAPLVDGAHWYIYYLMIMYFWHCLLSIRKLKNSYWPYVALLMISSVLSNTFITACGLDNILLLNNRIEALFSIVFFERYATYIIIGTMVYFITNNKGNDILSVLLIIVSLARNLAFVPPYVLIVIGFFTCVIIISLKKNIPQLSAIGFFSSISYCFYLIHQDTGYVLFRLLEPDSIYDWIICVLLAFAVCLLLSYIMNYIEVNCRKK